ncbi:MAG: ribosomal protein S18-alanine N-acetyltransferase [Desulfuromonadaceae bacterium]|nr:ribosomal protein S18-alanine N-acetyltransferase [Desulfuromonadaceae bacterium]
MNEQPMLYVRAMTEDDLESVVAIEMVSYATPWKREHFQHEIAARYSWPFVAVEDVSVVGYVCLMSLFEEAQILNVAVSPDRRGSGIARMLLGEAFRMALEQGAETMALEVRASNSAAISLYRQLGFERVGIRSGYYESAEDAILMEKNLKENL